MLVLRTRKKTSKSTRKLGYSHAKRKARPRMYQSQKQVISQLLQRPTIRKENRDPRPLDKYVARNPQVITVRVHRLIPATERKSK